jgi:uncharacterized protein YdeI (YjbR/CyaY-like superfamily)
VHKGCPEVEETIKWGMPSFGYKGILAGMAAFKNHCAFGLWKGSLIIGTGGSSDENSMGQFGKITNLANLPKANVLIGYIRKAAKLNDEGVTVERTITPKEERVVKVPAYLKAALSKDKKAKATFENFSYSKKKEYVEWLTEAKSEETREKRLATAIAWMGEGKSRMWKYERK